MLKQHEIVDDIPRLLEILPPHVRCSLESCEDLSTLIEVVLDLGRRPEARFPGRIVYLHEQAVSQSELEYLLERVGPFGPDNRTGIEGTLHRISGIRNRRGEVIGVTCRVGRAVYGTLDLIRDVVERDESVLFVGRPGIGKTTMLREFARVLADEFQKRVVIVDTSNEIAGDGDIPHPAIGRARRMQVPRNVRQADVMIEAVENHTPEVIIIDEIGTAAEADAARTIAERGVRLIGTAHGNTLQNLMFNPTLADLVGGIQAVTLGDEEARRRATQKTVLERKAPPTFDILIEIESKNRLAICHDIAKAVDAILRGADPQPEVRERDEEGEIRVVQPWSPGDAGLDDHEPARQRRNGHLVEGSGRSRPLSDVVRIFPYAVSRNRLERAIRESRAPVSVANSLQEADAVLTLKGQYRKMPKRLREAERKGLPIRVVRSNTQQQIQAFVDEYAGIAGEADAHVERRDLHPVNRPIGDARRVRALPRGAREERD